MAWTPEQNRGYQRAYYHRRRAAFFADKACERCGSTEKLELHHRDPSQKESHAIWTWSAERRDPEIAKCEVLCQTCHIEHHRESKRAFAFSRPRCANGTFRSGGEAVV